MDGSGYPNGLTGAQVRLESKIIAIADVMEAMASHRPYRAALGVDKAMEELAADQGRLFDTTVSLPLQPALADDERATCLEALRAFVRAWRAISAPPFSSTIRATSL